MTAEVETAASPVTTVGTGPIFKRADWALFRTLDGLTQMAGVSRSDLPQVVLKELVDNALDAAGACRFGLVDGHNGFWVEDDGPGFPGTVDDAAAIFSISRPLVSSKLLRLPTRGALGNGLRVVAGAVVASGGRIDLRARGQAFRVVVGSDGVGRAEEVTPVGEQSQRVQVTFDPRVLRVQRPDLEWSDRALLLAGKGRPYDGRTSAWWYDSVAFHELFLAAEGVTVRKLVECFDGCTGAKSGHLATPFGKSRLAASLTFGEADALLGAIRARTKPVSASRLGGVGKSDGLPETYKRVEGVYAVRATRGAHGAEIPYVVEAWAGRGSRHEPICLNRTPAPGTDVFHSGKDVIFHGGGLGFRAEASKVPVYVIINVTTPYVAKLSAGKTPDLEPFKDAIIDAGRLAAGRHRASGAPAPTEAFHKDAIIAALPEAIELSGSGAHRFSQRQLYYRVRPLVSAAIGEEPGWKNFCAVLKDYEAEQGAIPGVYRDARGVLLHPHTGECMPLGTLSVEQYRRPDWTFNKVLYIEKQGFFEVLKAARWPERHDCAVMTAKGFSTRAAQDLINILGSGDEPTTVYCAHDADAPGSMIYQTLQKATRASVKIVNLGLDPAEAIDMGLRVEAPPPGAKKAAADYLEPRWRTWLQEHRVELEAMTSEQFLAWLDRKMDEHEGQKVVPPDRVLLEQVRVGALGIVRSRAREILEFEARIEERMAEQVQAAAARLVLPSGASLAARVITDLTRNPADRWTVPVGRVARDMAAGLMKRET